MKKMVSRLVSSFLAAAMVMSLMVACGSSEKDQASKSSAVDNTQIASATQSESTPEPLKEVTLKFYFGGEKPSAFDEVWNAVGDKYKEKLNAKLEVNYVPWGDYVNKIMVMAAAGDSWDLNFTADWLGYAQLLGAGAFMPLNDLLPKYAPELYAKYADIGALDAATVDGKIMSLPWTMKQNIRPYYMWRKDLSPEIANDSVKTIEELDSVLMSAKTKQPLLRTLNVSAQTGFPYNLGNLTTLKYELADLAFHGFYFDMNDAGVKVVPFEQTQAFKEAVTYGKKWYDAGIIAKDTLIDKNDFNSYQNNGKSYSIISNNESSEVNIMKGEKDLFSSKGQKFERSLLYPDKKYYNRTPLANVVAIGKNAANPERALMFCNMMETDKEFYDMVMYGIEGKTYTLKGEEAIDTGAPGTASIYLGWTSQWPFWKPQFMRPDPNYNAGFWQRQGEFASLPNNTNSPVYGLFFNGDAIKTELTKRDQLQDEVAKPLLFGVSKSKDIDKELNDYIAAQKAAGTDKIVAELQKQVDAYLASKK